MSWADKAIEALSRKERVQIRPKGRSMSPLIESGQLVTLVPVIDGYEFKVKDIVLCKVGKNVYLHKIVAKRLAYKEKGYFSKERYVIGNNKGRINGIASEIYGIVIKIEP